MNSNGSSSFNRLINSIPPFLLIFLLQSTPYVKSQPSPPPAYPYANFNPSIIAIIVILVAALFLMGFFSIYIRRRSNDGVSTIRRVFSIRQATVPSRGLDSSVIETFPTFVYSTVKGLKIGKGALECAVCLNEYEDEETLRLIPKCDHVFHPECIDAWFENHVTCPVCRANLVPDPSELEASNSVTDSDSVSVSIVDDDHVVNDAVNDEVNEVAVKENGSIKRNESVKAKPKVFDKFRSHSTGHSLVVQPGENLDRFTLRLPEDVRKQVVKRGLLNRTGSTVRMVGEGSGKKGYRHAGTISGRRKSYRRLESVAVRSERWVLPRATSFLSRAFSVRSQRVVAGNGEASASTSVAMGDTIPLNDVGQKSC
ncbi:hypothetical protein QVD17_05246 [Tagetes erecta]|uniref:RING-type E3 ubiquitin transferase n=1 Tax=Tagetes erecta TaxID=13708 RepID=A0AAD8PAD6_TARER|nr:hypothetical protein QVD17_05246 [Tagetes erecta]